MSAFGGVTQPEDWSAAEADFRFNVYRECDRQDEADRIAGFPDDDDWPDQAEVDAIHHGEFSARSASTHDDWK